MHASAPNADVAWRNGDDLHVPIWRYLLDASEVSMVSELHHGLREWLERVSMHAM